MRISKPIILVILMCCAPLLASADVLMLKSGRVITGTFQGADQSSVTFQANGQSRRYPISEITSVTFTGGDSASSSGDSRPPLARRNDPYNGGYGGPTPSPAADSPGGYSGGYPDSGGSVADGRPTLRRRDGSPSSPAYSPAPPPPSQPSTASAQQYPPPSQPSSPPPSIHAGSVITVRMIDPVDSSVNQVGQMFRAALDEPVIVDGQTVIPRGADITAKLVSKEEAGRVTGRSELNLVLMDITVRGRKYDVTTSEVTESGSSRGKQSAERVGVGTVLGAAIGAIAGGGKGAAIGAATGAGAGTAVQLATHGEKVKIPAETRLDFTLAQPLNL